MYEYYNPVPGSPDYDWSKDLEDEEMTENEMKQNGIAIIEQASTFIVNNQQDYSNAAEICKDIKFRANQIKDYWKPLKEQAAAQHKAICAKESELLTPFTTAETQIKGKMADWQRQKMEEERLLREEQERWKKEEAERLLKEAAEAEQNGEQEYCEGLVELAEQRQNMVFEAPKQVKTPDTAAKKIWKARVINEELVPVSVAGAIIRPVDTTALDKLAKASKGSMKIPGVEFYEDVQISIRTR